jgi:nucleotide sugar dehydrogenase
MLILKSAHSSIKLIKLLQRYFHNELGGDDTMDLKEQLLRGEKIIGIWGLGYIGFSSMAYLARAGAACLGTDVFEQRVKDVNLGKAEIPNLNYWIAFDTKLLAQSGLMKATTDWKQLIDPKVAVHFIAIPTEKDGKPFFDYLKDVISRLAGFKNIKTEKPPLVIIESTLTPTAVDEIVIPHFAKHGLQVGKDILVGVAPRRDWFVSPDKTIETLPRVVGGTTPETTEMIADVASLVCKTVLKAKDHKHASIVKSIENAYRQVEITLANQLSLAYPDMDMAEVLKLAGTKWNMGTYHPSFGTGGYCIPLAPQYVLEGAKHPEELTILQASLKTDFSQPDRVVANLVKRGATNVGILGIAYAPDLKVHVLSPALSIVKGLKEAGIAVKVNDPYYADEEISKMLGVKTFAFPEGLHEFDAVLVAAGHMQYKYTNHTALISHLKNCKLLLDNLGALSNVRFPSSIEYHKSGDAGWLELP